MAFPRRENSIRRGLLVLRRLLFMVVAEVAMEECRSLRLLLLLLGDLD